MRSARADIAAALRWSEDHFGTVARERYRQLIDAGLIAIAVPNDPLGISRSIEQHGVILFHLRNCRSAVSGITRPRHLFAFRRPEPDLVQVLRLLHDAMDLPAHLAGR